jgi:hypothetical protein
MSYNSPVYSVINPNPISSHLHVTVSYCELEEKIASFLKLSRKFALDFLCLSVKVFPFRIFISQSNIGLRLFLEPAL